jgi:hypothetical protein
LISSPISDIHKNAGIGKEIKICIRENAAEVNTI